MFAEKTSCSNKNQLTNTWVKCLFMVLMAVICCSVFAYNSSANSYDSMVGQRLTSFPAQYYSDPGGIPYECVWYVRGRAKEKVGVNTGIRGNAKTWWDQAVNLGLHRGWEPAANSIACFNGGTYGHVIFVEYVSGNTVYYTEANVDGGICDGKLSPGDGVLKKMSKSSFIAKKGGTYKGCIYLAGGPNVSAPTNAQAWMSSYLFAAGQSPTFYASADNCEMIHMAIFKDGVKIDAQSIPAGQTYTRSFNEAGNYSYYCTVANSAGAVDTNWVNFTVYDSAPTNGQAWMSSYLFAAGQSPTFYASADNCEMVYLAILKDGVHIDAQYMRPGETYTRSFNEAGNYSYYCTVANSAGAVDTNWVNFTVYDSAPTNAQAWMSSYLFATGQSPTFYASADNCEMVYLTILKDGVHIDAQSMSAGQTYSRSFNEAGSYSYYCTVANSVGAVDTNLVHFTVYGSTPKNLSHWAEKSSYEVGEDVMISMYADYAISYYVSIFRNENNSGPTLYGECDVPIGGKVKLGKCPRGKFSVYMAAKNDLGDTSGGWLDIRVGLDLKDFSLKGSQAYTSNNNSTVNYSWEANKNASGYNLMVYKDGKFYKNISTKNTNANMYYTEPGNYVVKVRAYNCMGEYKDSLNNYKYTVKNSETVQANKKPANPTGVKATRNGNNAVKISWNKSANAKQYEIFCSTSANGKFTKIGTVTGNYICRASLQANTTYYYKVRAKSDNIYSGYSATVSYKNPAVVIKPANPTGVKATRNGNNAVKISWNKSANAKQYEVFCATSANGKFTKIGTVTGNYVCRASLKANTTYYYKVRAKSDNIYSGYSATVSYKNPAAVIKPGQIKGVKVTGYSYNTLKIQWTAISNATQYEVLRSNSKNGKYVKIATVSGRNYYLNSGVATSVNYYYKVRAKNAAGYGAYSEAASGKTVVTTDKDFKLTKNGANAARLTWKKSAGASGYEIYRSTAANGKYVRVASTNKTEFVNSKLGKGKPYYYKVRAYRIVNGQRIYGNYSAAKGIRM